MKGTRGAVILYEDLCESWIRWMREARLTNLGVHKIALPGQGSVQALLNDLEKPNGREMIERLEDSGVTVEYELHALEWLLPRELFGKDKTLFRMNDSGERTNDTNLCPSNAHALEIVSENAYRLSQKLRQNSDNYYLWPDDAHNASCHCEKCRAAGLNGADQGILMANAIAQGVRAYNPKAKCAYIAYADAKAMPTRRPSDSVFLEFAPMDRDHAKPITDETEERSARYVRLLEGLIGVFGAENTEVLEYWLDDAWFSGYKMPPAEVPLEKEVWEKDIAFYASLGIRKIKTFASYIGDEYCRLHGEPPVSAYGEILSKYITDGEE